ncbi:hypothetical protein [Oxalicibacterium faecigallinarum]|uniref:Uncharacterized protein n=1 Tax=Oxalicibacterium faecigallinarum TaxID=573741 RepID=A0A8J3F1R5_9BURK|nr:hypothetical protein [Oxalicibacterium faecigallinarum]GGI16921.1 hypothetical protein GCM10008066_06380 [Oxalicibacterium faecigallinarum]
MTTVAQVTNGNVRIRCGKTDLFIAGAVKNFDIISVTHQSENAHEFDAVAAEKGRKVLAALYPSFDWQTVQA